MIEVTGLTKQYGDKVAVKDLTFTVKPGVVTGFLGPIGIHILAGEAGLRRILEFVIFHRRPPFRIWTARHTYSTRSCAFFVAT